MKDDPYNEAFFMAHEDDSIWLVTYADLMTILLVFFILLYALVYFEKEKFKDAVERIKVQVEQDAALIGLMELMGNPEKKDTQISIEDLMPMVPNISEENRAQNRRVEFVLEKKKN